LNILTKICVVVLLILVLVASVVFINMATVPNNYRAAYEQEKLRAKLNEQAVRTQKLVTNVQASEIELLKQSRDGFATQLAELKQGQVPDTTALLVAEITAKFNASNTRLAQLQLNVQAGGKRNEMLSKQLEGVRGKIATMQKSNGSLTADLTQLRGELERSERIVRALERKLQDSQEQVADLEKRAPGTATGAAAAVAIPQGKVTGTITAVRGELASINVGAAQGVTRGQKLYIYRNASFVGYLRLDNVDEGGAAGTIIDKQLDPTVGDKVTNDLLK